jgi:hypothetical protein
MASEMTISIVNSQTYVIINTQTHQEVGNTFRFQEECKNGARTTCGLRDLNPGLVCTGMFVMAEKTILPANWG